MLYALTILFSLYIIMFVRKKFHSFSPASLFTFFWTSQILFMVIFWSGFLYFKYVGLLYILLCLFCFDLGYCVQLQTKPARISNVSIKYNGNKTRLLYYYVLALSFFALIYDIFNHGFSLQNLFDLNSFMEMSNQNSVERYSGEDAGGIMERLLGVNTYACAIIGGMSYYFFDGRKRIYPYIALLPLIIGGVVTSAKMGIITGTFLWLIGLLLVSQLMDKQIRLNYKKIFFVIIGIIVFFALLIIVMMFRIGTFDIDTMYIVFGKMISYSLGHLPAFDLWFTSHEDVLPELTGGGKTFYGITNSLGLLKREGGIFIDPVEVSIDGDSTNVFTIYRFFVEDFGMIGTLPFLFVMGMVCRLIYNHFSYKRYVYMSTTLLCGIYFFISWSFVSSIFAYATYIMLIFYLYFLIRIVIKIEYVSI